MERSIIFILFIALASRLDASCIDRDIKENNVTENADEFSNLLMESDCILKSSTESRVINEPTNSNKTLNETKPENIEQILYAETKQFDVSRVTDGDRTANNDRLNIKYDEGTTTEAPTTTNADRIGSIFHRLRNSENINDDDYEEFYFKERIFGGTYASKICTNGERMIIGKCRTIVDN